MAEKFVGKASEFKDGDRRIVFLGDIEIGVFRHEGQFYAYSNHCVHQGGPACEGLTIAKVEERIMPDKTSRGLYFSETEMHFVCPWHGYEYDLKTGECVADRRLQASRNTRSSRRETRSMSSPSGRPPAAAASRWARTRGPGAATPYGDAAPGRQRSAPGRGPARRLTPEALQAAAGGLARTYAAQSRRRRTLPAGAERSGVIPTRMSWSRPAAS